MQTFKRFGGTGVSIPYTKNDNEEEIGLLSPKPETIDRSSLMLASLLDLDFLNNKNIPMELWGQQFEIFLSELFKHDGYKVEKLSKAGCSDGGIDLILEKGRQRIAVQAKNYRLTSFYNIGVDIVRAFSGVIENRKDITSGAIITSTFFTEAAVDGSKNTNKKIELINREDLFVLVARIYPELMASAYFELDTQDIPRCNICGSLTLRKKSPDPDKKWFYGCIHFPKCKGKGEPVEKEYNQYTVNKK